MDTYALIIAGSAGFILGVSVSLAVAAVIWLARTVRPCPYDCDHPEAGDED